MEKIIILEPCVFTCIALKENLKHSDKQHKFTFKLFNIPHWEKESNIEEIFISLRECEFTLLILGNINPLFGPQAMIQFTLLFQHIYGKRKKLIHLSERPKTDILSNVFGLNVELVDICSEPDEIERNIDSIINDPDRGFINYRDQISLSDKQREVMHYFFQNLSMVEVAGLIGENPKTLCAHKRRALKKLGITHQSHLLSFSQEQQQIITGARKGNS